MPAQSRPTGRNTPRPSTDTGETADGRTDAETYMTDCLDGPNGCNGDVLERLSRSGSGMRFSRCEHHYAEYAQRMDAVHAKTRRRYPDSPIPPSWFDPTYAGERWDDE